MTKLPCEIIQDLIPLMEDDVCSGQSRTAVLEHIQDCEACRKLYEASHFSLSLQIEPDETATGKTLKKSFRKIRRRWAASILFVIFMIPVVFLTRGQITGRGICFTNIHELSTAASFMHDLQKGDYEAAASHLDISSLRREWAEQWFDEEKLSTIEEDAVRVFCDSAVFLKDSGGIEEYHYLAVERQPFGYRVYYKVTVAGKVQNLSIEVSDSGILSLLTEGSFLENALAWLCLWSEQLWQEYQGCHYNPVTGTYDYY